MHGLSIGFAIIGALFFVALIVASRSVNKRRWFVCAYCKFWFSDQGDISHERPIEVDDGDLVSHGCCSECEAKAKEDLGIGQAGTEVTPAQCALAGRSAI